MSMHLILYRNSVISEKENSNRFQEHWINWQEKKCMKHTSSSSIHTFISKFLSAYRRTTTDYWSLLSRVLWVLKASALPLSYTIFVANNSMGNLNAYKSICIQQSTEAKPTKWPAERTFQKAIWSLHTHTLTYTHKRTQTEVNNTLGMACNRTKTQSQPIEIGNIKIKQQHTRTHQLPASDKLHYCPAFYYLLNK